jgi:peroxiredoxin
MAFGSASAGRADEKATAKMPAVGDKVPDFTLQDLAGHPQTLSKLTADSPTVLVVLRGFPGYQCPLCTIQVGGLIARAKEFQKANAKVILVYPGPADQLTERAKEFVKGKALPENFIFVTDPDYKFTEAYGLRWDAARETAFPSTFVIDQKGIVQFAKVSKSHGDRSKPEDILQALEAKK